MPDLKDALMTVLGQVQNDTNALEAMLTVLRSKALKGDTKAVEILLDRAYGKPKQETDVMATFTGYHATTSCTGCDRDRAW